MNASIVSEDVLIDAHKAFMTHHAKKNVHQLVRYAVKLLSAKIRRATSPDKPWKHTFAGDLSPALPPHQLFAVAERRDTQWVSVSETHINHAPREQRPSIIFQAVAQAFDKVVQFDDDALMLSTIMPCTQFPRLQQAGDDEEAGRARHRARIAAAQARFEATVARGSRPPLRLAADTLSALLCDPPIYVCVEYVKECPVRESPVSIRVDCHPPLLLVSERFLREVYTDKARTVPVVCGEAPACESAFVFRMVMHCLDRILREQHGIHPLLRLGIDRGYRRGVRAQDLSARPEAWGLEDAEDDARARFLRDTAARQGSEDLENAWSRAVERAAGLLRPPGSGLARAVPLSADLVEEVGARSGAVGIWSFSVLDSDDESAGHEIRLHLSRTALEESYYCSGGSPMWSVGGQPTRNKLDFIWRVAVVAVSRVLQVCIDSEVNFPALLGLRRPLFEPLPLAHLDLPRTDAAELAEREGDPSGAQLRRGVKGVMAGAADPTAVSVRDIRTDLERQMRIPSLKHRKEEIEALALALATRPGALDASVRLECGGEEVPVEQVHSRRLDLGGATQQALGLAAAGGGGAIARLSSSGAVREALLNDGVYGGSPEDALLWRGVCTLTEVHRGRATDHPDHDMLAPSRRRPLFRAVHRGVRRCEAVLELPRGCDSPEALFRMAHPVAPDTTWEPIDLHTAVELRARWARRPDLATRADGDGPWFWVETDQSAVTTKKRESSDRPHPPSAKRPRRQDTTGGMSDLRGSAVRAWSVFSDPQHKVSGTLLRVFEEVVLPMLDSLHDGTLVPGVFPVAPAARDKKTELKQDQLDAARKFLIATYSSMRALGVAKPARQSFRQIARALLQMHPSLMDG